MILSGAIETKRLLFVSSWLLLSAGCSLSLLTPNRRRFAIVALVIVGVIGWAGIFARRWYSAQHFIEPWRDVAAQMAPQIEKGAVLVTNSPSLLFYLNYDLRATGDLSSFKAGRVVNPRVMAPIAFSRMATVPAAPVIFVRGVDPHASENLERVAARLSSECEMLRSSGLVPDNGTALKARLFPSLRQPPFRIVVTDYQCPTPTQR
jgi:hypothetical protein